MNKVGVGSVVGMSEVSCVGMSEGGWLNGVKLVVFSRLVTALMIFPPIFFFTLDDIWYISHGTTFSCLYPSQGYETEVKQIYDTVCRYNTNGLYLCFFVGGSLELLSLNGVYLPINNWSSSSSISLFVPMEKCMI